MKVTIWKYFKTCHFNPSSGSSIPEFLFPLNVTKYSFCYPRYFRKTGLIWPSAFGNCLLTPTRVSVCFVDHLLSIIAFLVVVMVVNFFQRSYHSHSPLWVPGEDWCWPHPFPTHTCGHVMPTWSVHSLTTVTRSETATWTNPANETFSRTAGLHLLRDSDMEHVTLEPLLPPGYRGRSSCVRTELVRSPVPCPMTSFELLNQTIPETKLNPILTINSLLVWSNFGGSFCYLCLFFPL